MQLTLLDIIEDINGTHHCELCGVECQSSIHKECADVWWEELVMKPFKEIEK